MKSLKTIGMSLVFMVAITILFFGCPPEVKSQEVNLNWTAPFDDGGIPDHYDGRYATFEITEANFASAMPIENMPVPDTAGTAQMVSLNVHVGHTYWFAIKTTDGTGNTSAISNVPSVAIADDTPPNAIINLNILS